MKNKKIDLKNKGLLLEFILGSLSSKKIDEKKANELASEFSIDKKVLEDGIIRLSKKSKVQKGGPGSGRYPAGSGQDKGSGSSGGGSALEEKMVAKYGITDNPRNGAFITSNGEMIQEISGVAHENMIRRELEDMREEENPLETYLERTGNIRMVYSPGNEQLNLDVYHAPNEKQLESIKKISTHENPVYDRISYDLNGKGGLNTGRIGASYNQFISDVKDFYGGVQKSNDNWDNNDWRLWKGLKKSNLFKKYNWQSTQFDMPYNLFTEIHGFTDKIPYEKLSFNAETGEGGVEIHPHVTVLYGLDNKVTPEQVKQAMGNDEVIEIKLGKTSIFEQKEFDVLKIEVESESLTNLHNRLKDSLNAPGYVFPEYKPHITLAYLKSGEGRYFAENISFEGRLVYLNELCFCKQDGEKITIPLVDHFEKADDGMIWVSVNGRTFPIDPSKQGVDSGFGYRVNKVQGTNYKRTSNLISHEGAPDKERIDKYKELLKKGQPISPLLVVADKNEPNKFGIEDGKHRFEALRQMGYNFIPAISFQDYKESSRIQTQYDKALERDQKAIERLGSMKKELENIVNQEVKGDEIAHVDGTQTRHPVAGTPAYTSYGQLIPAPVAEVLGAIFEIMANNVLDMRENFTQFVRMNENADLKVAISMISDEQGKNPKKAYAIFVKPDEANGVSYVSYYYNFKG